MNLLSDLLFYVMIGCGVMVLAIVLALVLGAIHVKKIQTTERNRTAMKSKSRGSRLPSASAMGQLVTFSQNSSSYWKGTEAAKYALMEAGLLAYQTQPVEPKDTPEGIEAHNKKVKAALLKAVKGICPKKGPNQSYMFDGERCSMQVLAYKFRTYTPPCPRLTVTAAGWAALTAAGVPKPEKGQRCS